MNLIKCHVIPEPEKEITRVVIRQTTTKVSYFNGNGKNSYVCGKCGFALAKGVEIDQIQKQIGTSDKKGLVLQCPECKSYNELGADIAR